MSNEIHDLAELTSEYLQKLVFEVPSVVVAANAAKSLGAQKGAEPTVFNRLCPSCASFVDPSDCGKHIRCSLCGCIWTPARVKTRRQWSPQAKKQRVIATPKPTPPPAPVAPAAPVPGPRKRQAVLKAARANAGLSTLPSANVSFGSLNDLLTAL